MNNGGGGGNVGVNISALTEIEAKLNFAASFRSSLSSMFELCGFF